MDDRPKKGETLIIWYLIIYHDYKADRSELFLYQEDNVYGKSNRQQGLRFSIALQTRFHATPISVQQRDLTKKVIPLLAFGRSAPANLSRVLFFLSAMSLEKRCEIHRRVDGVHSHSICE